MDLIQFPFERVVEINVHILKTERGHKGVIDLAKLQGALGRIDNAIRDLVIGAIDEYDFADVLYGQFFQDQSAP